MLRDHFTAEIFFKRGLRKKGRKYGVLDLQVEKMDQAHFKLFTMLLTAATCFNENHA